MPEPQGRQTGDLFVQVQVEVPKKLTDRQEELIRELAEIERADVSSHRKSFFEKLKEYFAPHEGA
jgi:molecular chaperone DnaJ